MLHIYYLLSITIRRKQTCSDGFIYEKHLSQAKGWREQGKWSEELLHQGAIDQQSDK